MLKNMLKAVKDDLWNVRSNKKYVQSAIKQKVKELETSRKEYLAENARIYSNPSSLAFHNQLENERFDRMRTEAICHIFSQWHEDQSYHLIYKDGSEVCVTAEEILGGEPFPKLSDIVYAELSSGWEHYDTETGDLDWYSEEAMKACDYDYDAEDERRFQYDTSIEIKYKTEWGCRYAREHPDFVPVVL